MLKILILADTPVGIRQVSFALQGHNLTFTTSSFEAAELLRENRFDAFVSAVYLEDSDIFQLLASLKADGALQKTPVILYSGDCGKVARQINPTVRAATKALGVEHYITMPIYSAPLLRLKVEHCLRRA